MPFSAAQRACLRSSSSIDRRAELRAGQIEPLPAADQAGLSDTAANERLGFFFDQHAHGAVGQHDRVAGRHFVDQRRIGRHQLVGTARLFAADKRKNVAQPTLNLSAGKLAETNFGAGQIDQHSDRPLQLLADLANRSQHLGMVDDLAMGHVQAEDVGAGGDQGGQPCGMRQAGPTVAMILVRP